MLTLTGAGGGCGTAETVGPEGGGTGAPAAGGVSVVVIASLVCPAAGGCTTVVVVVPFLSTETTCWACPVVAACLLASSSAWSSLDLHPERMPATNTSSSTGIRPVRTNDPEFNMVDPLFCVFSYQHRLPHRLNRRPSSSVFLLGEYCGSRLPAPDLHIPGL